MCVATSTAVGIGVAAASAGTSLIGAKMGSNAAKNAAATQSAAADKALAFQQQQYQQQRQDFAPYQQAGQGALGRLGTMSQQPPNTFDPRQPQGMPRPPQGMPMGNLGSPMGQPPQGPNAGIGAGMAAGQAQGQMVKVQGPDGSVRQVPQQIAQTLVQRGARIIQ